MSLLATNNGRNLSLSYLVGATTQTEKLYLKLYNNAASVNISLTEEGLSFLSTGNGYSPILLSDDDWVIEDGVATYPQQSWTFTGAAGNVYGYALLTETSNTLVFAENFSDGPYNVLSNGDIIRVSINISIS